MNPPEFMETIYLGDRGCKQITLDGWNDRIMVQVDRISRIRDALGHWNYYTAEDIPDGLIVLSDVESWTIDPQGLLPKDFIDAGVELLDEKNASGDPLYLFTFCIGFGGKNPGETQTVTLKIKAGNVHLEDPSKPGVRIRD